MDWYNLYMATLYLMLGYPGAGKTTTAEKIQQQTGAVHLSSDKLRLEMFPMAKFNQAEHDSLYQALDAKTEALLSEGKDVIYDANLNRFKHRQEKYDICRRTNSKSKLIWVQTPKEIAKNRATNKIRLNLAPQGEALADMFDRIAGIIETPHSDETFVVVDGTKVTPEYIAQTLGL